MRQQMLDLLPIMLLSLLAFAIGWLVTLLPLNFYLIGAIEFVVFVLVYVGVSYFTKMSCFKNLVELLPMFLGKFKKSKKPGNTKQS